MSEVNNDHAVHYTEDDLLELTSAEFSNTRKDIVATCRRGINPSISESVRHITLHIPPAPVGAVVWQIFH